MNLRLIKNSIDTETLNYIIHFGAGKCSELELYINSDAKHILLVEANKSFGQYLNDRVIDLDHIQVAVQAISNNPSNNVLFQYNKSDANSLHSAAGLKDIFPGLKQLASEEVEVVSPSDLIKPFNLNINQKNILIIDTPGEENNLITNLAENKLLLYFTDIILHCGRRALYTDSTPAPEILDFLLTQGYVITCEDSSEDIHRPTWGLSLNPVIQQTLLKLNIETKLCNEYQHENEHLKTTLSHITEDRNQLKQRHKIEEKQLLQSINEQQRTIQILSQNIDELEQNIPALQEQLEQQIKLGEGYRQEKDSCSLSNVELQKSIDNLNQENIQQTQTIKNLQEQLQQQIKLSEADVQEKNTYSQANTKLQKSIDNLNQERNQQTQTIKNLQEQLQQQIKLSEADVQEKNTYSQANTKLQKSIDNLNQERNQQTQTIKNLQEQLQQQIKLSEADAQEKNTYSQANTKLQKSIDNLNLENIQQTQTIENLQEQLQQQVKLIEANAQEKNTYSQANTKLQKSIDNLNLENIQQTQTIENLQEQVQQQIKLSEADAQEKNTYSQANTKLQKSIDNLNQEKIQQAQSIENLQEQLQQQIKLVEADAQEKNTYSQANTKLQESIDNLNQEKAQQAQTIKNLQEQLQQENQETSQRNSILSEELKQLKENLSLSLSLQTQKQVELEDLRLQYKQIYENEKNQNDILQRLRERLLHASHYFHHLNEIENERKLNAALPWYRRLLQSKKEPNKIAELPNSFFDLDE